MSAAFFRDLQDNTVVPVDITRSFGNITKNKRFSIIKAIELEWFTSEFICKHFQVSSIELIGWCEEFGFDPVQLGLKEEIMQKPSLDPEIAALVLLTDKEIGFTSTELQILNVLSQRTNKLVPFREILSLVYRKRNLPASRNTILRVYMNRIRRKLDAVHPQLGSIIESKRGRGFMINSYKDKHREIITESYATLRTWSHTP